MILWASLHIFLGIIEHLGPVVSLVHDFVSEGSTSCVVPTVAIMDLLHHAPGFLWPEAL